jgi:hypothetical protein
MLPSRAYVAKLLAWSFSVVHKKTGGSVALPPALEFG